MSLRSPDTAEALAPQDGLYTVAVRSGAGERLRVIGSVRRLLVAPDDPAALLDAMTDPAVRIVSLTVTEKGYCHDPATGDLNPDHPDIAADLADPASPRSAPGVLVEALRRRRAAGRQPFTVLCCDNLPENGRTVGRVLAQFAGLRDPALGRWVEDAVAFPSTMVDRIVPATCDADRAAVAVRLGVSDAWPVMTEPFTQWVIEDRFGDGRPRFEDAGAELVADVAPYELMKLRLLNGSHSTLAYLGYLAGHETVSDVMADPSFVRLVQGLMDEEVTPTLRVPPGADLAGYKRSLLERFANPALKHRTWQIAMDGSQKLPQRLLGAVRDRLAAGQPVPRLALGVAAWMRYAAGTDERGRPIDVRDPLAQRLRGLADAAGPGRGAARARPPGGARGVRGRSAGEPALRAARDGRARQPLPKGRAGDRRRLDREGRVTRAACIGECMIELSELPDGRLTRAYGGDTLNTAVYMARLGLAVDYVTALGDDPFSDEMAAGWRAEGIGVGLVARLPGRVPGLYIIQTDAAGERRFSYWRDSAPARDLFGIPETPAIVEALAGYDLLYFSGITLSLYGEAGRARFFDALDRARAKGARVAFDTNFRPRGWPDRPVAQAAYGEALGRADVVLASIEDLQLLFGGENPAGRLFDRPAAEVVLNRPNRPAGS